MKKRIFSALVILALLVTAAVFTVQAETVACPHCSDPAWATWNGSTAGAGHYVVTEDMDIGQIKLTSGEMVLDLAGHTLTATGTNRAFNVSGGKLIVIDSSTGKTGTVIGAGKTWGAAIYVAAGAQMDIYGGTFQSKYAGATTATTQGGVAQVRGTLNLYGGTLEAGNSTEGGSLYLSMSTANVVVDGGTINGGSGTTGGAVYVANGKLTVKSGTVNASTAATKGSAVYVATNGTLEVTDTGVVDGSNVTKGGGTVGTVYSDGTVTVSGGQIKGAKAGSGGSIFVNAGSLTVSGGKVFGGEAANYGDDIYVTNAEAEVTFSGGEVSGQVQINTAKTVTVSGAPKLGELKLPEGVDLTLGELTKGADICIAALDGAFTLENNNAKDYLKYFRSNNADKEIVCTGNVLYVQDKAPVVTEWECAHCGQTVTWTALTGAPAAGVHYYLAEERTTNITVAAGSEVILDLCGQNITVENNRAFMVRGTLHLMDSLNTGVISSGNGTSAYNGGVFSVQSGATVNMYSGTAVSAATTAAAKGSVAYVVAGGTFNLKGGELDANGKGVTPVYVNGAFTMIGGKITGNEATLGGSVYVSKTGDFTLTGGTIGGGSSTGAEGVYAEGGDNIYVDGGVFAMTGGTVVVNDTTHRANAVLGVNNAKITLTGLPADSAVSGHVEVDNTSTLTANCGAGVFDAMSRQAWYATADQAMAKYKSLIRFYTDGSLALTKKACVDANGHKVAVTADESLTEPINLAGMDSTATLSKAGTGEITIDGENINVPLSFTYGGNRYVSIVNEGKVTYHVISLAITKVSLRPSSTGIYYTTGIYCDDVLEKEIATYGVAVSLVDVPTSDFKNPDNKCLYTEAVANGDFQSGEFTGALVNNILSTTATNNADRAQMPIYANAYVIFANGETMVNSVSAAPRYNLKDLVQSVNRLYPTLDGNTKQTDGLKAMYNKFADVMSAWDLNNIQADAEGTYGEVKHLKVLTLGHSLAVDAGHMLAKVAAAEGATDITVGTLYYSGCTLTQHVNYLTNGTAAYDLYYSNLMNADNAPAVIKGVTMEYGLKADNWDIIIMQAGVFEAGLPAAFDATAVANFDSNIDTIMNYVKQYRPSAKFVWNMTWACPGADSGLLNESYTQNFDKYFSSNQMAMYEAISEVVKTKIATNSNFIAIIPTGTAMQNANETMTDTQLYRDSIHATDLARVMASYAWYSVLTGRELKQIKLDVVTADLCNTYTDGDMVLTDAQKDLILNCVNNAIKTPYAVTTAN